MLTRGEIRVQRLGQDYFKCFVLLGKPSFLSICLMCLPYFEPGFQSGGKSWEKSLGLFKTFAQHPCLSGTSTLPRPALPWNLIVHWIWERDLTLGQMQQGEGKCNKRKMGKLRRWLKFFFFFFSFTCLCEETWRLQIHSVALMVVAKSVVSSGYRRLVKRCPPIEIPAPSTLSKPPRACLRINSAYMLKRLGDKLYPWLTPYPVQKPLAITLCCLNCDLLLTV